MLGPNGKSPPTRGWHRCTVSAAKSEAMVSREFLHKRFSIISRSGSPIAEQERVAAWQLTCVNWAGRL